MRNLWDDENSQSAAEQYQFRGSLPVLVVRRRCLDGASKKRPLLDY
jgi:hypothetical protein